MAEGLLAAALPDAQVSSAGLAAMVGHPADPIACELMHERGISIDAHRAQQISLDVCQRADLILVMDGEQRRDGRASAIRSPAARCFACASSAIRTCRTRTGRDAPRSERRWR